MIKQIINPPNKQAFPFLKSGIPKVALNFLRGSLGFCGLLLAAYLLRLNYSVAAVIFCAYLYFRLLRRRLQAKPLNMLYLAFLFVLLLFLSYLVTSQRWPVLYIPFACLPMLCMLLFDHPQGAFIISVASALAIASLSGNNYFFAVLFLVGGISSIICTQDLRRRISLLRAAFIVGLSQAGALLLINGLRFDYPQRYFLLFFNGVACGFIVLALLPLLEILFKTTTNISLLELADFNNHLLQRLIIEAPGTYHHSLVVGNLSEAASRAIGAEALLARIGAYYHDIGKLSKPEYFSENQAINESKHDSLSPTMSKMIIMNHVKEGLELARKYRLSPRLIDFIEQHHGNSLVYYFYRRALENLEDDQQVREEGFRYPGPRPKTKETAIVLLADSVEAATRSLKDPTPVKIEETVHKIINNKFIDGQLDECDLTLKDLEKISSVFIRILSGIYHSRAAYPENTKAK